MEGLKDDPEFAMEMVVLLRKELKAAKRRIEELELQQDHNSNPGVFVADATGTNQQAEAARRETRREKKPVHDQVEAPRKPEEGLDSTALSQGGITGRDDIHRFLRKLPSHKPLPPAHPVFHCGLALEDCLAIIQQFQEASTVKPPIFMGEAVDWVHKNKRRIHALIYSTKSMYNLDQDSWNDVSPFIGEQGNDKELFYTKNNHIYYAGTFRCHLFTSTYPDGLPIPQTVSPSALASASLSHDAENSEKANVMQGMISKLYAAGTIKAEPVGLQMVGFNVSFYEHLKEWYHSSKKQKLSKKRKSASTHEGNPQGHQSKKVKTFQSSWEKD